MISIDLCGDYGTRYWPLPRNVLSKRFASIVLGKSLLHLTLVRTTLLADEQSTVASE